MWNTILLAILLVVVSRAELRAQAVECIDLETTALMRECLDRRLAQLDAEIDSLNVEMREVLLPSLRPAFERSVRAWLLFRDLDCIAHGALWEGGSIQPVEVAACFVEHSVQRRDQLRQRLTRI